MASLRLRFSLLTPDVECAALWPVFPSHTFSHDSTSKTGESRSYGGYRRRGWRNRAGKVEDRKHELVSSKGEEEQEEPWEAAQRRKPEQKRSVTPCEKLRHPEMLLKG